MSIDYFISTSLLLFVLFLHLPLNYFHLPPPVPISTKLLEIRKQQNVLPMFCVTGEFEIKCTFYITGRNSFMFVSITLSFAKSFVTDVRM